jgi:hypothetical protein
VFLYCMIYDMIYLTAIGLTPGGSSTHLHTKQYIEQHNQTIHRATHYRHKKYMEQYNSRMEQYNSRMEQYNSRNEKSFTMSASLCLCFNAFHKTFEMNDRFY